MLKMKNLLFSTSEQKKKKKNSSNSSIFKYFPSKVEKSWTFLIQWSLDELINIRPVHFIQKNYFIEIEKNNKKNH